MATMPDRLGSDGWSVYYWSAQVTCAPCLCRSIFGADAHLKHVPTTSAVWNAGGAFEKVWDATLLGNLPFRIETCLFVASLRTGFWQAVCLHV